MADNRYGRDNHWRGMNDRDRMRRDRDHERGDMGGRGRDDDRNFSGAHRGRSSYFEESYGAQDRGDRDRSGFGRDDDRGDGRQAQYRRGMSGEGYGSPRRDGDRSSMMGRDMTGQQRSDRDSQRGYGGMSGEGTESRYGYQGFAPSSGYGQRGQERDEQYHSLRKRHLQDFDRQYEEFRRHQQDRHAAEFEEWRRSRSQSDPARQIREHMDVVGSDGLHVGTVDNVEGSRIKLSRKDPGAGVEHHYVEASLVRSVDDKVRLSQPAEEIKRHWQTDQGRQQAQGGATSTPGLGASSGAGTVQSGAEANRSTRK